MRLSDFELYREILLRHSGQVMAPEQSSLLDARLTPVAKKWGYPTFESMTIALRGMPDNALVIDVVEAMTSNETMFFRDMKPFETLRQTIIPYFLKERARHKSIRIWSAACSTGEEAYSIAMVLDEFASQLKHWDIDIIATDLSHDVLSKARTGTYSQFEIQRGLPTPMLIRHFEQIEGGAWKLKPNIRNMVDFHHFNLLDRVRDLGPFDVVLCRNVLSSLAPAAQAQVLANLETVIEADGFLTLGEGETIPGDNTSFKPVSGVDGYYGPAEGAHRMDRLEKLKKTAHA